MLCPAKRSSAFFFQYVIKAYTLFLGDKCFIPKTHHFGLLKKKYLPIHKCVTVYLLCLKLRENHDGQLVGKILLFIWYLLKLNAVFKYIWYCFPIDIYQTRNNMEDGFRFPPLEAGSCNFRIVANEAIARRRQLHYFLHCPNTPLVLLQC